MIHISKMGDKMSPEDKELEGTYRLQGKVFRLEKDQDGRWLSSIFFDLKDLEYVSFALNVEVEEQYNKELKSLENIKPEDIRF